MVDKTSRSVVRFRIRVLVMFERVRSGGEIAVNYCCYYCYFGYYYYYFFLTKVLFSLSLHLSLGLSVHLLISFECLVRGGKIS